MFEQDHDRHGKEAVHLAGDLGQHRPVGGRGQFDDKKQVGFHDGLIHPAGIEQGDLAFHFGQTELKQQIHIQPVRDPRPVFGKPRPITDEIFPELRILRTGQMVTSIRVVAQGFKQVEGVLGQIAGFEMLKGRDDGMTGQGT